MSWLSNMIIRFPKVLIVVMVGVTVMLAFFAVQVEMTTDVKDFFPEDHIQVVTYNEIERTFGSAEYIMVALETENVFTKSSLETIAQLTSRLAAVPGVAHVRSLTTIEEVKRTDWGVEVVALLESIPDSKEGLLALQTRVLADSMYAGVIVSQDGTAALQIMEVERGANPVDTALLVQAVVRDFDGPETLYLTGTPVLNAVLANSMQGDLKVLLPLVLLLVGVILFLFFRTLRGVFLPFMTVLISLIWTLGFMGLLGKQMSPLNAVMPVILVSLGNAYGIYLLARFNEELQSGKTRAEAVTAGLASVGVAVLLAGSTTVAGFLSNATSSITQMQDFGLFTAVGVLVALFTSLILLPAIWVLLPTTEKQSKDESNGAGHGVMAKGLRIVGMGVTKRYRQVLIVATILTLVALMGIPNITTDSNFFNFFDEESQPRVAYDLVADKFSGSESIEIVVQGDILDPTVLLAMKSFQEDLKATGLVGSPTSVLNILERAHMALNEGELAFQQLLEQRNMIAQVLVALEMSGDGFLSRFLTMDYSQARIQALVSDSSSEATTRLFAEVERLFIEHFGPLNLEVTQTGIIALLATLAELIIDGQVKSLLFALIAVFVIARLLLRSWEGSLLSTLLVAITIVGNFGLMGWLSIPLDIVTVLISSIGVGVGIDYSIHIYSRFQEEQKKGQSAKEAVAETIGSTGQAILINALAVMVGFVILLSSSFPPFRYFGSLVTATMLFASLGSLTLLPALILWNHRRKDTLARTRSIS